MTATLGTLLGVAAIIVAIGVLALLLGCAWYQARRQPPR